MSGDCCVEHSCGNYDGRAVIRRLHDKIERLQANNLALSETSVGELFDENTRLRAAGDALAKKIDHLSESRSTNALVKAWQEARRER